MSTVREGVVEHALGILGTTWKDELLWLADRASSRRDCLDLGTYLGRTAWVIGWCCQGHAWTVDDLSGRIESGAWVLPRGQEMADDAINNLALLTQSGKLTQMQAQSPFAAAYFEDESLDMVWVDADHSEATRDVEAFLPKLRDGGLMCGHDRGMPGVAEMLTGREWTEGPGSIWCLA